MPLRLTILSCVLVPSVALSQVAPLAGAWTGYWTRAGDTLPVTMVVHRDTAGRHTATFDSERLRVSGIPFAEVRADGCCTVAMVLRGDQSSYNFKGQLRGDSLVGVFLEGTNEGLFAFVRAKPAVAAFEERDITFRNGDITLAGTLLLPRGQGRVPAVVFLHGSGAEGRWASRYLASQIASHGIASLIFDKRGVGGSSGDWRLAGPDELAADAVAAVAACWMSRESIPSGSASTAIVRAARWRQWLPLGRHTSLSSLPPRLPDFQRTRWKSSAC